MAVINTQFLVIQATEKFRTLALPAGTDRTRYQTFLSGICQAIGSALSQWQAQARLEGVRINGPIATGGKLVGPALESLILQGAPAGWDVYARAVAAGVHNQFRALEREVSVPGLPWYPQFAAWPGPVAPPMPNVPTPFIGIAANAERHLKEATLGGAIYDKLPNPKPACANEVAKAVASGIEKAVLLWFGTIMVKNVLGKGPVPSFAPPYVPVGPVVMGDNISAPGHLAG
jgi:hypothetical protein